MTEIAWTPIQKKMIDILSDGERHSLKELHACRGPSTPSNTSDHVAIIRSKLKPLGQTIIAEYSRRQCFYRRVILFRPSVGPS